MGVEDWLQLGKMIKGDNLWSFWISPGSEGLNSVYISGGGEKYSRDISVVALIGLGNWLLVEDEGDNRVKDYSKFQVWETGRMAIHLPIQGTWEREYEG